MVQKRFKGDVMTRQNNHLRTNKRASGLDQSQTEALINIVKGRSTPQIPILSNYYSHTHSAIRSKYLSLHFRIL